MSKKVETVVVTGIVTKVVLTTAKVTPQVAMKKHTDLHEQLDLTVGGPTLPQVISADLANTLPDATPRTRKVCQVVSTTHDDVVGKTFEGAVVNEYNDSDGNLILGLNGAYYSLDLGEAKLNNISDALNDDEHLLYVVTPSNPKVCEITHVRSDIGFMIVSLESKNTKFVNMCAVAIITDEKSGLSLNNLPVSHLEYRDIVTGATPAILDDINGYVLDVGSTGNAVWCSSNLLQQVLKLQDEKVNVALLVRPTRYPTHTTLLGGPEPLSVGLGVCSISRNVGSNLSSSYDAWGIPSDSILWKGDNEPGSQPNKSYQHTSQVENRSSRWNSGSGGWNERRSWGDGDVPNSSRRGRGGWSTSSLPLTGRDASFFNRRGRTMDSFLELSTEDKLNSIHQQLSELAYNQAQRMAGMQALLNHVSYGVDKTLSAVTKPLTPEDEETLASALELVRSSPEAMQRLIDELQQ